MYISEPRLIFSSLESLEKQKRCVRKTLGLPTSITNGLSGPKNQQNKTCIKHIDTPLEGLEKREIHTRTELELDPHSTGVGFIGQETNTFLSVYCVIKSICKTLKASPCSTAYVQSISTLS